MTLDAILNALSQGGDAARSATGQGVRAVLEGTWNDAQIAAFLGATRLRLGDAASIASAVRVLREHMVPVPFDGPIVMDTCGTGGDGTHTLNLSTAAAFVLAALGVPVAKHGNRSVSSRCGSADVIEAMGVPLTVAPGAQAAILRDVGLAFLMAPAHHPALRHAAKVRKELGLRTLFNGLGPLANPAGATHQVLGVWDDAYRVTAASVLYELGTTCAWVVHAADGMDELSPSAATRVTEVTARGLRDFEVVPEDFGLERLAPAAYAGGDAMANAQAIKAILSGAEHPATHAVALAAAAGLVVARGMEPKEAGARALECLASGDALRRVEALRAAAGQGLER